MAEARQVWARLGKSKAWGPMAQLKQVTLRARCPLPRSAGMGIERNNEETTSQPASVRGESGRGV